MIITAQKYKAKIEPVEAMQYTRESLEIVKNFLGLATSGTTWSHDVTSNRIRIFSPKGTHKADFGDWIVKGKDGFFVVKQGDFAARYEPLAAEKK